MASQGQGGRERRFLAAEAGALRVERRAAADGEGAAAPRIVGHVARFGEWSPVYGDFRERIAPGFFDAVLGQDVRALFNHSADWVLGRTTAGTLRLSVDSEGLLAEILPPASGMVADLVLGPLERGDVTGASFSFLLPPEGGDTWSRGEDGVWERTLLRCAELYDCGPVTFPWYPTAGLELERALESRAAAIAAGSVPLAPASPEGEARELEWLRRLEVRRMRL